MKKFLLITFFAIASISLTSCTTTPDDDGRNPQINNEPFTNYVPWWASNNIEGVTNHVESNQTNSVPKN